MKKILNFIIALVACTALSQSALAQKVSEGKIIYDITYPGTELDQNTMAMLPSESVMYFKNGKSRMEMKTGMGNTTAITNGKDGSTTMLMDMMGNKIAMKMTKEEMNKQKGAAKPEVQITDETKEIAGYKCTKAVVTTGDHTNNVWFTKDIEGVQSAQNQIEGIDGFMMEFQVQQQGMNMKMSVREVQQEKVDDKQFVIPTGYKEMTMDQMLKANPHR